MSGPLSKSYVWALVFAILTRVSATIPRKDLRMRREQTSSNFCLLPTHQRYTRRAVHSGTPIKGVMHEQKNRFFFRSVNAILGKVGRVASDEVILQLVFSKCIPVLLYGLESLPLTRSDERSLDFIFNRFMVKLFGTTDMNVTY